MSNLLKSKFILGLMIVIAFTFAVSANAAITSTLKFGSRGAQVTELQQALNVSPATGYFGNLTKAAVKAFQANKGLTADGIFGAKSRVALGGSVSGNFPAGCTSASGFSSTTGQSCYAIPSTTNLPAGCTSTMGYSSTTGASCATVVVVNTGPLAVALAIDNPASGSFIVPASGVQFAKFTFSGNGTVNSVKLLRTGISASTTVNNVYLYDGATRLTDGASIGSDNTVTFNSLSGLFTVAGSKTITVVADTLVADYSLGFNLISYTSGTTPTTVSVAGNLMYGASATLATVAVSNAFGSGSTDAGTDITVWQGTATVSTRDVVLKSLALRQIGSIASGDIRNFKLYADGVLVTTVANLDSNGYVTFSTPVTLKTGARVLKVSADVIGGSSRTVNFSLRGAFDLLTTDTQYNANGTTTGTFPFAPAAFTVNAGSLTVVKKIDSQSSNVTLGASDQVLATYTFTAYGEPVKVETLRVGMFQTGGGAATVSLRNVRIMVDGSQVGSNTTVSAEASFASNSGTSFTTNFMVYPGTPVTLSINSDIFDNEGTDEITAGATTAVQAVLVATTGNAVPQTSLGTISTPSANVVGNNLTISSGSIAVAKTSNYTNQTIAVPATAYKIGSFQLSGNSTEAVNLNTLYVGFTTGSIVTENVDLSDLYVVYGGTTSSVKGTVSSTVLNGNSWSINKVLAKNETMQIDVYATLASSVSTNAIITTLAAAGTTASSGIVVYADATSNSSLDAGFTGQTITGGTGSFTITADASKPIASLLDDNGTKTMAAFKFAAVTDSYTVTDLTLTIGDVSTVSMVKLYDGTTLIAEKAAAAITTFNGLSWPVLAGQNKVLSVQLVLGEVGVGMGTSGASTLVTVTAVTARNSGGTSAAATESDPAGSAMYVYKAVPSITNVALPTTLLSTGNQTVAKFQVNTNGTGTIAVKKFIFTATRAIGGTDTLATPTLWDSNGNQITGTGTFAGGIEADGGTTGTIIFVATNEEQISDSKTYLLKVVVAGTPVSGDNINVSIAQPSTFVAPAAYATVAGTTASFVWSDVSASSHSETTLDWSNGYLVKNLPTDSQTLIK